MRSVLFVTSVLILGSAATAQAGCVTGAIVGGVAGHLVGHGAVGAAAGCAVGHHEAKKKDAKQPAPAGQGQ